MKLSGLTFAPIVAFGLSGLLTSVAAAPIDGYVRRSPLSDRVANLPAHVARSPKLRTSPAPLDTFPLSLPAASIVALPSTTVLVPESNAPIMLSPGVAQPSASRVPTSLVVKREDIHQRRVIAPVVRRPGMVPKYQERLNATRAVTVARTPVPGRSGTASLNRFVFRRQQPPAAGPIPVTATRVDALPGRDDLR